MKYSNDIKARMPKPRIGLLPMGHSFFWNQFPGLKEKCLHMGDRIAVKLMEIGDVISAEFTDTTEKAFDAGKFFRQNEIDILITLPLGYATGMMLVPCAQQVDVPIRILNAHLDSSYDYPKADIAEYLYHEGPCCIPEHAAGLITIGKKFQVRSGPIADDRLWKEIKADCVGAAAAKRFRTMKIGVIGETYTNMVDMPIDEHRWLKATGNLVVRPEVEEIEEAYHRVTPAQLEEMYGELTKMYEVDDSVSEDDMRMCAQLAIAYEEIIRKHDIYAFGYYWWGEKSLLTQMRAQSTVAVSRLGALGRPGVTEGDVKTAMAMKILDLMGAGGMFIEFFALDYDEDFILMGHDGPSNINMASGRPKLSHLSVHHGKSGHGLGIEFDVEYGPVTLLNLSQFNAGDSFKLIYTIGETIPGKLLNIGNPNCRVKITQPIHEFMNKWCQQGPSHHIAMGIGDRSAELETFAEAIGFQIVRV